jgi:putative membrane protein
VKTAPIVGGALAALLILSLVPGLSRGGPGYGYGMMWPGMMGGVGFMFLMPVLWIAVVGLIVWGVVAAVRRPGGADRTNGSPDAPLEILKRRYARGEVTKEEFDARKKDLV